jgi:drug/metabolite transporter (DMT)-like permease
MQLQTNRDLRKGHLAALVTILLWGTTYISTKILLKEFQPVEILLLRYVIALGVLFLLRPKRLKLQCRKHELYFALAGLTGVCMYYLLENIALTMTSASNVGVIGAVSPFFTAIFALFILKDPTARRPGFFIGFAVAIFGIGLITFQGAAMGFHLAGDLLVILSTMVWACYSVVSRIIGDFGYPTVQATRRMFLYGILFMLPFLKIFGFHPNLSALSEPVVLGNLIFLGVGASALCFVSWNYAVIRLGAVKTSVYIYLIPVVTVLAAVIVLHERITFWSGVGIVLTISGLFLSQGLRLKEKSGDTPESSV